MCESSGTAKMSEKSEKMSYNAENGGWTAGYRLAWSEL